MSATDIAKSVDVDLDLVQEQAASVAEELIAAAKMKEGQILVVGCSSSEIAAHAIGCYSSKEVGEAVFNALYKATRKHGLYLAAQCCEHLNRAIIIEEEAALKYGLEGQCKAPAEGRRLLLHRRLEWLRFSLRRGADPGPRRH